MKNAYFALWLAHLLRRTEKTTTTFRLRMDRFIEEVEPIRPVWPAHISYQLSEEIRSSGL